MTDRRWKSRIFSRETNKESFFFTDYLYDYKLLDTVKKRNLLVFWDRDIWAKLICSKNVIYKNDIFFCIYSESRFLQREIRRLEKPDIWIEQTRPAKDSCCLCLIRINSMSFRLEVKTARSLEAWGINVLTCWRMAILVTYFVSPPN